MESKVEQYNANNINDFLKTLGLENTNNPLFYISSFKGVDISSAPAISYKHDYFEINLCIGLDAKITIDDYEVNSIDYNLNFISSGQKSSWDVKQADTSYMSYIVLFSPEFLPFTKNVFDVFENFPFFNHFTIPGYKLDRGQINKFIYYFDLMIFHYKKLTKDNLEIIRAYLTLLLFKIKDELAFVDKVSSIKTKKELMTLKFENLIKSTPEKFHPIKFYADKLDISTVYLSECVKEATNLTAKQILDDYIMIEAKSLVEQSNLNSSQIATRLGFIDNSNFIKYFKSKTGFTPMKYKKEFLAK
ncbi:helix-turn-helix domain-containing protein [Flammeovirga kamogawensis]|uniref:AraC family transcriptional regulator n=1 Tax=Flammeovirga kamogawensis TaxID=373891 RepID=A0ABX8H281_9BACT|nr:helix-turn-helix domain-containing protein [Flammeovirga kamogawensis]MBB6463760.1 AraC-like DNA-binding protein [Flammeovirga kamogawensis]QWG09728.1 AraC family transcriptional regulator [Flammeovirga kamogawensis]TRX65241.1 helix-turn-helix domain-containing protein [Flammeovirga kamogawensis]